MRQVITPTTLDSDQLGSLVRYLHSVREEDRVSLARQIHDEIGGHLVSAVMDLGWAESHTADPVLQARLHRLGLSLGRAVSLEREVIEQLRPTLLDTIGLFEALRWYFKLACEGANATCTEALPKDEVDLSALALTNIFRATQCLLDCTFTEKDLCSVDFAADVKQGVLTIRIAHRHTGDETIQVGSFFELELSSAAHRLSAVGGELVCEDLHRGTLFALAVPLAGNSRPAA